MYTHSKFKLDGVNWDFEGIIRIIRLEIGCDEARGGEGGHDGIQREKEEKEMGEQKGKVIVEKNWDQG